MVAIVGASSLTSSCSARNHLFHERFEAFAAVNAWITVAGKPHGLSEYESCLTAVDLARIKVHHSQRAVEHRSTAAGRRVARVTFPSSYAFPGVPVDDRSIQAVHVISKESDDRMGTPHTAAISCSTRVIVPVEVANWGRVKWNTEPSPWMESPQMRPPKRSTTRLQVARPMPLPSTFGPCSLLNGSKIPDEYSGLKPWSLSVTDICQWSRPYFADMRISGATSLRYLSALPIRFWNTITISVRSAVTFGNSPT